MSCQISCQLEGHNCLNSRSLSWLGAHAEMSAGQASTFAHAPYTYAGVAVYAWAKPLAFVPNGDEYFVSCSSQSNFSLRNSAVFLQILKCFLHNTEQT